MSVELNHTIINVKDKHESAAFVSEVLGLPAPVPMFHFLCVATHNGVTLDFLDSNEVIQIQHYAFLVSEKEFDEIFGRIVSRKVSYWADPARTIPGKINNYDRGKGVYFVEPSGHLLEIITKPYGSGK